jgi:O-antigen ligase
MWFAGIRMLEEKPIFGHGPGTFFKKLDNYYRPWDQGRRPPHENSHNYFIQVAAETGLLGLVGFLWVVFTGITVGFTRPLNEERTRARLLTIGLAGYLLTALFGHPLVLSVQAFLFWGCLGILTVAARRASDGRRCDVTCPEISASAPHSSG